MMLDTNIIFGYWKYSEQDCSIEKVNSLLKKHKIEKALAASMKGIFYDDFLGNDETLEVCKKNENLYPVGTVCLGRYIDVDEEVAKRKEQGFKAFRLFSEYQSVDFQGIRFKNFLKILEKYKMPLIVRGTDMDLGSYIDKIAYASSGINIPVIILDASAYNIAEAIEAAKFNENISYSTRLFSLPGSIEAFCEEVSPKRLVFGSGMPFYYGNQSIFRIQTAYIDESVREDIFSNNIKRILGIETEEFGEEKGGTL